MEEDIFLKNYPRLDLHGYDRDYARMLTNDFILENVLLKKVLPIVDVGTKFPNRGCIIIGLLLAYIQY